MNNLNMNFKFEAYPWTFDPKDDITLTDVVTILKVLGIRFDGSVHARLPSEVQRHFRHEILPTSIEVPFEDQEPES